MTPKNVKDAYDRMHEHFRKLEEKGKVELVKRHGKTLLRITVGGKSKAIKRAEKRIQKRQREIHAHFERAKT